MSNFNHDNKLTALFVFHNSDFYSGATRSLIDILDSYIKNNSINIVALFPRQGTAVEYLTKQGIPIIFSYYTELVAPINQSWIRKFIAFPIRLARLLSSIFHIYNLKETLAQYKIGLVYTNTSVIFAGGLISKFFKIPHIWHFREFRREDQQIDFFFGRRYFFKFANKYANKIVVISKSMYQKHEENINPDKLRIIYNDISPNFINPKPQFNLNKRNLQLLITGTLSEGKGQLEALKAVKILIERGYELILNIAGSTNCKYFDVLSEYVNTNKLQKHVVFHGLVKDMNALRKDMDIGIVASRSEAFGRVTIEGMLSCMVMIGRNSAGTSELIKDMETGLLYRPDDLHDLVDKIEYLHNNRSEIERIGKRSFKYAVDKFTIGNCSKEILDLLNENL